MPRAIDVMSAIGTWPLIAYASRPGDTESG
jgi:hypothetical protein